MSHLNDNLFQNVTKKLSPTTYDTKDTTIHKAQLPQEKKHEIIEEIIVEHPVIEVQNKEFTGAIDKILITHRDTRLALFLMSW